MEGVDSAAQDKRTASDLVINISQHIDRLGVQVSRVSPSGKYLAVLRMHKRVFPLWWKWEAIGYSVSPGYKEMIQVLGRLIDSAFSDSLPTGCYHIPILLEFRAIYQELPQEFLDQTHAMDQSNL